MAGVRRVPVRYDSNDQRNPAYSRQQYAYQPGATTSPTSARVASRQQMARSPPARQRRDEVEEGRGDMAQRVARGGVGGGYGPYAYDPQEARQYGHQPRFSNASSVASSSSDHESVSNETRQTNAVPWWEQQEDDLDDPLHNPDPVADAALDKSYTIWSGRGWLNAFALGILGFGLLTLFAGYPIIADAEHAQLHAAGFGYGGVNASGQVPLLNMPSVIDSDTPSSAYTRTGTDGKKYNLVFSDEFNLDGRTFWPGDDPFWEAQNFHYWPTGDLEWYDPSAITTHDGKLVITLEEMDSHNLDFQSGMLTSWNKVCVTTGYIEVSVSLPGSARAPGLWPAVWTMGNLGKAGYGATTEGMWPYSYAACDLGTYPNQTAKSGTPAAANGLSYLPGQRLSACSCPGSDHPGPTVNTGRGVPEIDILEAQVNTSTFTGAVSQSAQVAPFNAQYYFDNTSSATSVYNDTLTHFNIYRGGQLQQAVSAVSSVSSANYDDAGYATYGIEWWSDPNNRNDGYISWMSQGEQTWKITADTIGPDTTTQISSRLISEEPMYVVMNLGLSPGFQEQDWMHLQFPSKMFIDYVRVYQREGFTNLGCDPQSRPTAQYINDHLPAYTNPNFTTWAQANYTFPRNSQYDGCS